jgi:vacuolar-type H+-ATPase subunit H
MRDVIQKVIATETEAKRLVEAAEADAERIGAAAQQRAQDLLAEARQKAREEADQIMANATRIAGQEKQERLARAMAEIESEIRMDETTKQRAVAGVIRCVCGQRLPA